MYEYIVKRIVKVVDGDTLDVELDLGFNIFTIQRIRLAGIDAPETRTKDLQEKESGLKAKNFVVNFFEDCETNGYQIYVKTTLDDKYGRMLGRITANNKSLNDLLISNKLAFKYEGGAKPGHT